MFSSGWKPQCCSDFNSGWEGVRQCHEHAAFNPPWHSYNLLWWRNRHGEHCIRKCKWRACKLWSCCCLVPSNGRFQNTRTFVLLTKLSLSHSLLKWFSMFLMANLCKSKWEWPGQRPEPRLWCVSELADFSYGCWFLSFSGSVWPGFQQCSFSRKDSKCQHWAWPGVRRGVLQTCEGRRAELSPSSRGSALIIVSESIISWLLLKGNHGSDSVQATAVMSVPKLRKRDLHEGEAAWWQAQVAFGHHA